MKYRLVSELQKIKRKRKKHKNAILYSVSNRRLV